MLQKHLKVCLHLKQYKQFKQNMLSSIIMHKWKSHTLFQNENNDNNTERLTAQKEDAITVDIDLSIHQHRVKFLEYVRKHREELTHMYHTYIVPSFEYHPTLKERSLKDWLLFAYTQTCMKMK
jgi:hypothetical protein